MLHWIVGTSLENSPRWAKTRIMGLRSGAVVLALLASLAMAAQGEGDGWKGAPCMGGFSALMRNQ